MPLTITDDMVIVGFLIKTEGAVAIRNSYYELGIDGELNDVELVLSTTTFKKEAFIERNIGLVTIVSSIPVIRLPIISICM